MRWVFIRPKFISLYYDPEIQEPLGLEYLAASRIKQQDKVLILDSLLSFMDNRKLARRAASFKPDIIGFSLTTAMEIDSTLEIYHEINRVIPHNQLKWLAGGNFVSTEPDSALRLLPDTFTMVINEGENALQELVEIWTDNSVKKQNNMANPVRRIYTSTSCFDLTTPIFPVRPYAKQILEQEWAFSIQGSRGCCGTCRFCASPGMGVKTNKWRGRPIKQIVDEIQYLNQFYGAYSFNFIDEDFLGPVSLAEERAIAFCEELKKRQLTISFGIQVRPSSLSETSIKIMTNNGLTYVFMGLESDDPDDFKYWQRPWVENPWRYVELIRQCGAEINTGVMLFHSRSTLTGIRRFAEKLHQYHLLEYRSAINQLDAMPGSFFYQQAKSDGIIPEQSIGPQQLPFKHPEAEKFRHDLLQVLSPLGPVSMQAICSLPPLIAKKRIYGQRFESAYKNLKSTIDFLDNSVAESFFQLLSIHEREAITEADLTKMQKQNLEKAIRGAKELVQHGFADSFSSLRTAIKIDSGL